MLAACASEPPSEAPHEAASQTRPDALAALIERNPLVESGPAPLAIQSPEQCVPYAREHSGIDIHGDAYTWWDQAAGRFARGATPQERAVMVLTAYAGPSSGHVAVVRQIISAREIRIDHANWLNDGSIYLNDPVTDVSADNDWSVIKVWNIKDGNWGSKAYPVRGFIGPGDAGGGEDRIASLDHR